MKYILKYQDFESVNEELNWWQKLLLGGGVIGSMFSPKDLSGQTKDDGKKVVVSHIKTSSDKSSDRLVKKGWTLDKTVIDTLWEKVKIAKPDTELVSSTLQFDDSQFFPSGKFTLDQEMINGINQELERIESEGGLVTDVMIESSTDKQGLSNNLQNILSSMKYEPNNKGLSQARCDAIKKHLIGLQVSPTIIQENPLYEKGTETIDQSARYVFVRFVYIVVDQNITPGEFVYQPQLKKTHYLSKETKYKKSKKSKIKKSLFKWGSKIIKRHGPLKNRKLNLKGVECSFECSFE